MTVVGISKFTSKKNGNPYLAIHTTTPFDNNSSAFGLRTQVDYIADNGQYNVVVGDDIEILYNRNGFITDLRKI